MRAATPRIRERRLALLHRETRTASRISPQAELQARCASLRVDQQRLLSSTARTCAPKFEAALAALCLDLQV